MQQMAEDLEAEQTAVSTDGYLIMIGHSIGGMILQSWSASAIAKNCQWAHFLPAIAFR
jgi:surfactin synthase thioesterase subunit